MSATATSLVISSPNLLGLMTKTIPRNGSILFCSIAIVPPWRSYHSLGPPSMFFRIPYGSSKGSSVFTASKPFAPVMEWQNCTVKVETDVPVSVAYNCYSDREAVPRWMPSISSVKILEDKPELSRWSMKYKAFGRDVDFSWLTRNFQPIPNQKIHWRSLEGVPNRGAVRFYPKGPSSCIVELTVSYEVPQIFVPVASALQPFLEGLLRSDMERFASFVKSYQADPTR
ncbi:hypothetical protein I3843_07G120600 [Carya illinoinensis]|uniref:Coenzyme Q-binding protein COQ10 START domain-containing protein n=1 Tax=Carya illinoinensis TaxID=32201 RepID=A0A8T1PU35_CARIL|nr:uncharacterized protein LOC122316499 [Carya illinoinensis]KAG2697774.1 hypothetical protein I3760_07G121200 [Carya illinoinensis]KAG6648069.1 hypothetical protein CIPAW_07G122600 [Carya illinoinensis]KAG6704226.1 hypothetical protein I3842_07G125600 [Carya illinoinensis]KAG7971137.1 hypothetical protein I3843_07G120600 [Carya illinoinensis]